jgi:hypothetical protein
LTTIALAVSKLSSGINSLLLDAMAPDLVARRQGVADSFTPAPALQHTLADRLWIVVSVDAA